MLIAFSAYCVGVAKQGIGHFKHFISPSPAFLPLHLLDAVTKPLTMALRLFGNILAGEILLIVLYQLAPWVVPETVGNVLPVHWLRSGFYLYHFVFGQLCTGIC